MEEILDYSRLAILINEVFWCTIPSKKGIPFQGNLIDDLAIDSLDALDLASEFHFRFDMLSGEKELYLLQYKTAELWIQHIYSAANDPQKRFGFFTSGSTGKPKETWHSKKAILQERDFWLKFTKVKGVICLAPVRHIYGFIWGLLMGTKLKRAQFLPISQWHEVSKYANENDAIIGHPAAWQQIKPPFPHRLALSSTAPIEEALTTQLCEHAVRGMNVYGSTETGAIAWQVWGEPYFQLIPYWKKSKDGLSRDELTAEIPDHLEWLNEEQFKIIGRKDEMIQIGGINVSLAKVRDELKNISGVKEVWVRPFHSNWGLRIFSYFQLNAELNKDQFERDLPNSLDKIPSIFRPRKWKISHKPFNKLKI